MRQTLSIRVPFLQNSKYSITFAVLGLGCLIVAEDSILYLCGPCDRLFVHVLWILI